MHLPEEELNDVMSTEDSKYLLRALELDAYSSVLSALRAQGPLTEYKKVLIDHLRTALFIPIDRHKCEMRRVTNDETLAKLAKKLSPCSDTFFSWFHESNVPGSLAGQSKESKVTSSIRKLADNLMELAEEHNEKLSESDKTLLDLIQLPKVPNVPEALRSFLQKTEDVESKEAVKKLDIVHEKPDTLKSVVISAVVKQEDVSRCTSAASRAETPSSTVSSEPIVKIKQKEVQKLEPTPVVKKFSPVKVKKSPVQLKVHDAIKIKHKSPIKPKLKHLSPKGSSAVIEATFTCARIQPFRFPPPPPGSREKPPRGNPDRRTLKRPISLSSSTQFSPSTSKVTGAPVAKVTSFQPAVPLVKKRRTGPTFYENLPAVSEPNDLVYAPTSRPPERRLSGSYSSDMSPSVVARTTSHSSLSPMPVSGYPVSRLGVGSPTPSLVMQAAYNNPTRPYYGNPSAAAMGITVKPVPETNPIGAGNGGQKLMVMRRGEDPNPPIGLLIPPRPPDLGPPFPFAGEPITLQARSLVAPPGGVIRSYGFAQSSKSLVLLRHNSADQSTNTGRSFGESAVIDETTVTSGDQIRNKEEAIKTDGDKSNEQNGVKNDTT